MLALTSIPFKSSSLPEKLEKKFVLSLLLISSNTASVVIDIADSIIRKGKLYYTKTWICKGHKFNFLWKFVNETMEKSIITMKGLQSSVDENKKPLNQ